MSSQPVQDETDDFEAFPALTNDFEDSSEDSVLLQLQDSNDSSSDDTSTETYWSDEDSLFDSDLDPEYDSDQFDYDSDLEALESHPLAKPTGRKLTKDERIDLLGWVPSCVRSIPDLNREEVSPEVFWVKEASTGPMSLGDLDKLPPELINMILQELDAVSSFELKRTCRKGNILAKSQPKSIHKIFNELAMFLAALRKTGVRDRHTLPQIWDVLTSNGRCTTCGIDTHGFGPWVFLPTLERACYRCILTQKDFRLVRPDVAMEMFALTPQDLRKCDFFLSLRGPSRKDDPITDRFDGEELISLQVARQIATRKHGEDFDFVGHLERNRKVAFVDDGKIDAGMEEWDRQEQMREMLLPDWPDGSTLDIISDRIDTHGALASWQLPVIGEGNSLDYGHYCFGCLLEHHIEEQERRAMMGQVRWDDLADLENPNDEHVLCRTRKHFLRHVRDCDAARLVKKGIEVGLVKPEPGRKEKMGRRLDSGENHEGDTGNLCGLEEIGYDVDLG
ncbi:hypothetical protein C1H76_8939 [Elsinoe australis]|uniref:F-box domain-containing protein n=1 Tax=Elsinoe australis TaxID=40998 RepID=A0A4U7ALX4_9PEZI|nr:hypothetical protein C1H76_8939 [Elsinoe australis]